MKIVSACLGGINCRYNGGNHLNNEIEEMIKKGLAIPVCPEQLGGMPTPRTPCEIREDRVYDINGKDQTTLYQKGAEEALKLALLVKCTEAILKNDSPMCGCGRIYDGTFQRKVIKGDGIFTKLLKKHNIKVSSR